MSAYQYVAGRLIAYSLRKEVYGSFEPESIYEHVKDKVDLGFYDENLLMWYTRQEFDLMDSWIDHSKDENLKSFPLNKPLSLSFKDGITNNAINESVM